LIELFFGRRIGILDDGCESRMTFLHKAQSLNDGLTNEFASICAIFVRSGINSG